MNVWGDERLRWWMSEVMNVRGDECLILGRGWWKSEVMNVWGDECLRWWTSEVMNVWGDECLKIGRGWWMSEVMNVWGDECRGDECRTIIYNSIDRKCPAFVPFANLQFSLDQCHVSPKTGLLCNLCRGYLASRLDWIERLTQQLSNLISWIGFSFWAQIQKMWLNGITKSTVD